MTNLRITQVVLSVIYKFPDVSNAILFGLPNCATFPLPFAYPDDPVPARVLTIPVEMTILRITWLKVSATYMFPELSNAIPCGL